MIPAKPEPVFTGLPLKKADLILLILASQKIPAQACASGLRQFDILVSPGDRPRARACVDLYIRENATAQVAKSPGPSHGSAFYAGPALVIMFLMAGIHVFCISRGYHETAILTFGASSLYISQGEVFRAVTALFLHANSQHLLGNLAGLMLFASPLITLTGYGTGPFLLLAAGTCGNLINAGFHHTALITIGASTAIMGAAGALTAFHLTAPWPGAPWKRLLPLFAGMTLAGMLSQGEHTDIFAHAAGFLSGLAIGILFFPLHRVFHPKPMEPACLVLVLIILGSAGWCGLG